MPPRSIRHSRANLGIVERQRQIGQHATELLFAIVAHRIDRDRVERLTCRGAAA